MLIKGAENYNKYIQRGLTRHFLYFTTFLVSFQVLFEKNVAQITQNLYSFKRIYTLF